MKNFSKKGFTLIELLVTITIIGILAVGGIQVFTEQMKKARDTTNIKNLKMVESGITQYILDNGKAIQLQASDNGTQRAKHFKDSVRTYVPNIDNIEHSASNKFCSSFGNGCGYRYVVLENTDQYRLYSQMESSSKVCDLCTSNSGRTEVWLQLGNNINLAGTMPGVRAIVFDKDKIV